MWATSEHNEMQCHSIEVEKVTITHTLSHPWKSYIIVKANGKMIFHYIFFFLFICIKMEVCEMLKWHMKNSEILNASECSTKECIINYIIKDTDLLLNLTDIFQKNQ